MAEEEFNYWDGLPILIQNNMDIDQNISGKVIEDFDPEIYVPPEVPDTVYEEIVYEEAPYEGAGGEVIRTRRYFLMFRGALSERFRKAFSIKTKLTLWEPPKALPQPFQESVHSEQSVSVDFLLFRR